jgi:hypothetical protein
MKLNKKVIISGLLLVVLFSGFVMYGTEKRNNEVTEKVNSQHDNCGEKNIVLTVSAHPDFGVQADTLKELTDLAEGGIIYGKVEDISVSCDDTGTVYSTYLIKVVETIEGNICIGDLIKVTDFGGIISADEYFEKQTDPKALELAQQCRGENNFVQYIFGGSELPQIGQEYIWYLEKGENYNGIMHYSPVCSYEGVFDIDRTSNTAERYMEDAKEQTVELDEIERMAQEN